MVRFFVVWSLKCFVAHAVTVCSDFSVSRQTVIKILFTICAVERFKEVHL